MNIKFNYKYEYQYDIDHQNIIICDSTYRTLILRLKLTLA